MNGPEGNTDPWMKSDAGVRRESGVTRGLYSHTVSSRVVAFNPACAGCMRAAPAALGAP